MAMVFGGSYDSNNEMAKSSSIDELIMKAAQSLGYSELKLEQKSVLKAFVGGIDGFVYSPYICGHHCYVIRMSFRWYDSLYAWSPDPLFPSRLS